MIIQTLEKDYPENILKKDKYILSLQDVVNNIETTQPYGKFVILPHIAIYEKHKNDIRFTIGSLDDVLKDNFANTIIPFMFEHGTYSADKEGHEKINNNSSYIGFLDRDCYDRILEDFHFAKNFHSQHVDDRSSITFRDKLFNKFASNIDKVHNYDFELHFMTHWNIRKKFEGIDECSFYVLCLANISHNKIKVHMRDDVLNSPAVKQNGTIMYYSYN